MRFTIPLAVATATAFTVSSLPVHAFPGASVNLVRVDGQGIRALPDVKLPSQIPTKAQEPLLSQATPVPSDVKVLATGTEDFEITYGGPLPRNLTGYISVRVRSNDASNGQEVERIPIDPSRVRVSADGRTIIIRHDRPVRDGETLCALLPDGPAALPSRQSPCCFTVAKAVVLEEPAPGRPFPWWIIPVGLGLGVGICALAGCFDSGGGGGGGGGDGGRPSR